MLFLTLDTEYCSKGDEKEVKLEPFRLLKSKQSRSNTSAARWRNKIFAIAATNVYLSMKWKSRTFASWTPWLSKRRRVTRVHYLRTS